MCEDYYYLHEVAREGVRKRLYGAAFHLCAVPAVYVIQLILLIWAKNNAINFHTPRLSLLYTTYRCPMMEHL